MGITYGDYSQISGQSGFINNGEQPHTRPLPAAQQSMISKLRFVTPSNMLEGEKGVECFQTIAERLKSATVEVTIKEHVEVVEALSPINKESDSRIKSTLKNRQ